PGAKSVTTRNPSAADSLVPAVEGSTKRLRTTICITSPAMAMAAPASTSASVRGTRLATKISIARGSALPESSAKGETSLTPMKRLTTARMTVARKARSNERTGGGLPGAGSGQASLAPHHGGRGSDTLFAGPAPPRGEGRKGCDAPGALALEAGQHLVEQQHHALVAMHRDIGRLRVEIDQMAV